MDITICAKNLPSVPKVLTERVTDGILEHKEW